MVRRVLSSGKKAIGAGAGNPPVIVDDTADIRKAAKDIIDGCTFDNNLPCIAEKEVFAFDNIADELIHYMKQNGAYMITAAQADALAKVVLVEQTCKETGKVRKIISRKWRRPGRRRAAGHDRRQGREGVRCTSVKRIS